MSKRVLVGVDGCRAGWLALVENSPAGEGRRLDACVFPDWKTLMSRAAQGAVVGVDIPIGLPTAGSRACDFEARARLGHPRSSSVFPAPVRGCLDEGSYETLRDLHRRIDQRGLTRQAYFILPKIREVDRYLTEDVSRQRAICEVHPELSFTLWNGGRAMSHRKVIAAGRIERERLIDAEWPGERERLWARLRGNGCGRDDLNDAFAALWTARRIAAGSAVRIPERVEYDDRGLRMEIVM